MTHISKSMTDIKISDIDIKIQDTAADHQSKNLGKLSRSFHVLLENQRLALRLHLTSKTVDDCSHGRLNAIYIFVRLKINV